MQIPIETAMASPTIMKSRPARTPMTPPVHHPILMAMVFLIHWTTIETVTALIMIWMPSLKIHRKHPILTVMA